MAPRSPATGSSAIWPTGAVPRAGWSRGRGFRPMTSPGPPSRRWARLAQQPSRLPRLGAHRPLSRPERLGLAGHPAAGAGRAGLGRADAGDDGRAAADESGAVVMLRSWRFRALAWFEGSLLAAGVLALELSLLAFGYDLATAGYAGWLVALSGLFFGAYSIPVFMLGLVIFGGPVWWGMHRLGLTSPPIAATACALGCVTIGGAIILASGLGAKAVFAALLLLLPGAIAGWVIQRVAYAGPRPPRPSPARPS
jgi:hypothetical protein